MDMSGRSLGQALLDVPIGEMLKNLGLSIAEAQNALDQSSIETARYLASTKVDLKQGNKSLLELGFTPTFYQFTEATIDVSMTITMRVSEETKFGLDVNVNVPQRR